jgi:hypothetical protein
MVQRTVIFVAIWDFRKILSNTQKKGFTIPNLPDKSAKNYTFTRLGIINPL